MLPFVTFSSLSDYMLIVSRLLIFSFIALFTPSPHFCDYAAARLMLIDYADDADASAAFADGADAFRFISPPLAAAYDAALPRRVELVDMLAL